MDIYCIRPGLYVLDTSVFSDKEAFHTAYNKIDASRRKKIDALVSPEDKRLSLGTSYLLCEGLYARGIEEYVLAYDLHNKPYLASHPDVHFSLSHSKTMALCVFSHTEIGADIEKIRPVEKSVMHRVTTEKEYEYLQGLSGEEKTSAFIKLWTGKESYAKYTGAGLSASFRNIEVRLWERNCLYYNGASVPVTLSFIEYADYLLSICKKS